jgi:O-antigen/teichoic acid export membrane protein
MRTRLLNFLRQRLGLDRAIAASSATQMMRFITGPVTMLLIIRFLTPEEQGFFYSFAGVVGIQVFLEAGFSQSITQFTSREFAFLRFNRQGLLVGNRASLSRLRSIFHKANRYYKLTAAVLALALASGGYWFFSLKDSHGVPWMIPWFVASACAGLSFLMTPFWAILEGCNRVAQIAVYRFWQTIAGFVISAICLSLDQGIYTVVWASVFMIVYPLIYLVYRWRRLILQIMRPAGAQQVSWGGEIWGFQWRIAGTWMSRYFLESGIAPLAFHLSGPVVAGQIGMTFQIVRLIGGVANTWTVLKIPHWGALAASGKFQEIEASWFLAARRNVTICALGMGGFMIGLVALIFLWPSASTRFMEPRFAAGFAVGWLLYSVWLVSMHYTRALRKEPYTFLHLSVGIIFLGSCLLFSKQLGNATIPWIFALVHLPAAILAVFLRRQIRTSAQTA